MRLAGVTASPLSMAATGFLCAWCDRPRRPALKSHETVPNDERPDANGIDEPDGANRRLKAPSPRSRISQEAGRDRYHDPPRKVSFPLEDWRCEGIPQGCPRRRRRVRVAPTDDARLHIDRRGAQVHVRVRDPAASAPKKRGRVRDADVGPSVGTATLRRPQALLAAIDWLGLAATRSDMTLRCSSNTDAPVALNGSERSS